MHDDPADNRRPCCGRVAVANSDHRFPGCGDDRWSGAAYGFFLLFRSLQYLAHKPVEPSRQHMRPAAIPFMLCCAVRVLAGDADGSPLNPVEFAAGSQPLGSLQQRHARERGEIPKDIPGDRLSGYLAKPESEGPNPAVVALHGPRCHAGRRRGLCRTSRPFGEMPHPHGFLAGARPCYPAHLQFIAARRHRLLWPRPAGKRRSVYSRSCSAGHPMRNPAPACSALHGAAMPAARCSRPPTPGRVRRPASAAAVCVLVAKL